MPPLASVYLNISFKTDGILILAPSCGVLSPIHFPIRQSPSTPPFFLPRCSVLSSLWLCHPSLTHSTFFLPSFFPGDILCWGASLWNIWIFNSLRHILCWDSWAWIILIPRHKINSGDWEEKGEWWLMLLTKGGFVVQRSFELCRII